MRCIRVPDLSMNNAPPISYKMYALAYRCIANSSTSKANWRNWSDSHTILSRAPYRLPYGGMTPSNRWQTSAQSSREVLVIDRPSTRNPSCMATSWSVMVHSLGERWNVCLWLPPLHEYYNQMAIESYISYTSKAIKFCLLYEWHYAHIQMYAPAHAHVFALTLQYRDITTIP